MVFFIPAGGKGLICGAGSARSRRGRHTLRCRCIPAPGGRRPMLSSPPLSVRAHILRCRGCFIFLFFFYGILPHWRLHFLPVLTGRKRNKGRNSRPRFRPKISPRRLPPRNSLPAVAQTSAPASRRPVKIFPAAGRERNGRGAVPVLNESTQTVRTRHAEPALALIEQRRSHLRCFPSSPLSVRAHILLCRGSFIFL